MNINGQKEKRSLDKKDSPMVNLTSGGFNGIHVQYLNQTAIQRLVEGDLKIYL